MLELSEITVFANFEKNGDVSFTYGCLDPVMVTQMAKYLDTVYVSGWQCSSTASSSDEPGPDLADYPMVASIHTKSLVIEN
jgi:isocitrate lyase